MKKTLTKRIRKNSFMGENNLRVYVNPYVLMNNPEELCGTKRGVMEFGQERIPHVDPYFCCVLCDGYNYNCSDYE